MAEVIIYERAGQRRKRTILSRRRDTLLKRLNCLEESLKSDLDIDVEKCLLDNLSWTFWSLLEVEKVLNGRFDIIIVADE